MGDAEQNPAPGHGAGGPADEPDRSTATELPERVRRRLADVFGDVLPDITQDEAAGPDDTSVTGADDWLQANRPPHHDRG
jgi:hypothetical protein